MIEFRNVSYAYKDIIALKNVNINISKGECIAVIGPNGSGKSTLLRLLCAIAFPNSGEYLFDGKIINENSMRENFFSKSFHKRVGFVFQNSDSQLFCTSVYDEVAFAPIQMGFSKEELDKRVKECLTFLGIEHLKDRTPYSLSGGEKKKVAIASVLSHNPDVLILDEPMNALDPKTKRFIRELIVKLNDSGKTIICATHDFEYVEGIFKRALVFSDEHVVVRDDEYEKVINDREFLLENNII